MNAFGSPPSPDPGGPDHYEKTQLRGRPFVIGVIVFFLLMGGLYVAIWGLMRHWSGAWPLGGQTLNSPVADQHWNKQAPSVQTDPSADLEHLRALEYRRLHRCQWENPEHTYAAIPIEDAMKLLSDAAAQGRLDSVLPPPRPATPIQLQDQKSREVAPVEPPNP